MIPRDKHITYIITINKITITYDSRTGRYRCKGRGILENFPHRKDAIEFCNQHKRKNAKDET